MILLQLILPDVDIILYNINLLCTLRQICITLNASFLINSSLISCCLVLLSIVMWFLQSHTLIVSFWKHCGPLLTLHLSVSQWWRHIYFDLHHWLSIILVGALYGVFVIVIRPWIVYNTVDSRKTVSVFIQYYLLVLKLASVASSQGLLFSALTNEQIIVRRRYSPEVHNFLILQILIDYWLPGWRRIITHHWILIVLFIGGGQSFVDPLSHWLLVLPLKFHPKRATHLIFRLWVARFLGLDIKQL